MLGLLRNGALLRSDLADGQLLIGQGLVDVESELLTRIKFESLLVNCGWVVEFVLTLTNLKIRVHCLQNVFYDEYGLEL